MLNASIWDRADVGPPKALHSPTTADSGNTASAEVENEARQVSRAGADGCSGKRTSANENHAQVCPGTLQWNGACGHKWFIDPANELTVVTLTNTAFEGMIGRFPLDVRNAVYGL